MPEAVGVIPHFGSDRDLTAVGLRVVALAERSTLIRQLHEAVLMRVDRHSGLIFVGSFVTGLLIAGLRCCHWI